MSWSSASSSAAMRPSLPCQARSPARRVAAAASSVANWARLTGLARSAAIGSTCSRTLRPIASGAACRGSARRGRRARRPGAARAMRGRACARRRASRAAPRPRRRPADASAARAAAPGASSSAAADAIPSSKVPGGSLATAAVPALSSASMPQRREQRRHAPGEHPVGSDQRRRLPGVSSASRSASAIACASAAASANSAARTPLKRPFGGLQSAPFVAEFGAVIALATARAAHGRRCAHARLPARRCTSPRATPIRSSSSFR